MWHRMGSESPVFRTHFIGKGNKTTCQRIINESQYLNYILFTDFVYKKVCVVNGGQLNSNIKLCKQVPSGPLL
jgi:hypothetical protein